jgi:hypothetical protein
MARLNWRQRPRFVGRESRARHGQHGGTNCHRQPRPDLNELVKIRIVRQV